MRSVLVLLTLIMAIVIAACGSSGLSNNQFPCRRVIVQCCGSAGHDQAASLG